MIINCPSCGAQFDVEDRNFLPAGRSVRCSECGESWFVPAPQPIQTLRRNPQILREGAATTPPKEPFAFQDSPGHPAVDHHHQTQRPRQRETHPLSAAHPSISNHNVTQTPLQFDQSASFSPPDHERALSSRETDHIVDTQWEDVTPRHKNPSPGSHPSHQIDPVSPEHVTASATRNGKSHPRDEPGAAPSQRPDRRKVDRRKTDGQQRNTKREFHAAISVQPRELEEALHRIRRKTEVREKNRLTPGRVFGWMMLVSLSLAGLFSAYHFRDNIVSILPASEKLYASFGIQANPFGLSLENLSHRVAMSTAGPILEISGELHNGSLDTRPPPLLLAEVLDGRGKLLASWTFAADPISIAPGQHIAFTTRYPAPDGLTDVVLSLAPEKSQAEK